MSPVSTARAFFQRLAFAFEVEPGELRPTVLLSGFLLLGMATVICLKAVSDSVFLSEFDASRLPYVDLAVTGLVGLAVNYYLSWTRRASLARLIYATQLFVAASLVLFWILLRLQFPLSPAMLYVWVGVFAVLIPSQVWSLAGLVFNTRQAKRLFSLVGSGGILGAALGGSFAGAVGPWIGAEQLLPASACFVVGSAWCVWALSRSGAPTEPGAAAPKQTGPPIFESLGLVWNNPYLRVMALAVFASTIAGTLVKFQYKAVLQLEFGSDRDALTSFSGYFYGYIAVFSFVFHTLFTSRLLRRLGVSWCLLILPLSLMTGMVGLLVAANLFTAILARGGDQAFRHSIDRASSELLFVPVPADLRNRVKSFLDMAVGRAADGAASLILVVLLQLSRSEVGPVSLAGIACVIVWMGLILRLRREYLNTLRTTIERPNLEAETLLAGLAESGPSQELEASLQSSDRRDLEAAVGWLQFQSVGQEQAQLASLLEHDSPTIRHKALAAVLEHEVSGCHREVFTYLRREGEIDERWRALEYLERQAPEQLAAELRQSLTAGGEQPEATPLAATEAAWALAHESGELHEAAKKLLRAYVETALKGSDAERADAARLLGRAGSPAEANGHFSALLSDPSPQVVLAALECAGRLKPWSQAQRIIDLLEDRRFAPAARRALAAFGKPILEKLSDALRDSGASATRQRQAARAIGMIGGREASRYLLAYLRRPQQAAREEVLRALNRLRESDQTLLFDRDIVQRLIQAALGRFYQLGALRQGVETSREGAAFLRRSLSERMLRAREEALILLGLIYPVREIRDARSRLASGRPDLQSNAVEFLDSRLLGNPLRPMLLPALEESDDNRLLAVGAQLFDLETLPYPTVMRRLLENPDAWLRACSCYAIAEAGVTALAPRVAALEADPDPILREAAAAAGARLQTASEWNN
ncbi:MAG: hypothetical protein GC160_16545 [Acidobacteria bacterium]|nr:hypothetical protein [Acidobacteriota bacterium]